MIQTPPPNKPISYPDIVYILYEGGSSETKKCHSYKNAFKNSCASYINSHLHRYLKRTLRPLSFDMTASCSNSFHPHELIAMPEVHVYSNIELKCKSECKIKVHDLNDVIKICPINVFEHDKPYIPALKAATILYHSQNGDQSRQFFLSDTDIIYYQSNGEIDERAIYFCGLEYQPLFSFLCFRKGLKVWSAFGKEKHNQIEEYRRFEEDLKMPLQAQIFNNGVLYVPHIHAKRFFDIYYEYLIHLNKVDGLRWPWPFWTAEMFASNYAAMTLAIENNVPVRRFDPDVMNLVHDINGQYAYYFDEIIEL